MITIDHATIYSVILFGIGLAGVLTRRNLIIIFVSVEIMLNAVNLNLLAMSRQYPASLPMALTGESVALFVILLAACEAAVGLGILLVLRRHAPSLAVDDFRELSE